MTTPGSLSSLFFFNDTATTEIYTLSLHDALPISNHLRELRPHVPLEPRAQQRVHDDFARREPLGREGVLDDAARPEEIGRAQSELQSQSNLVCRLLLEKKKKKQNSSNIYTHYARV